MKMIERSFNKNSSKVAKPMLIAHTDEFKALVEGKPKNLRQISNALQELIRNGVVVGVVDIANIIKHFHAANPEFDTSEFKRMLIEKLKTTDEYFVSIVTDMINKEDDLKNAFTNEELIEIETVLLGFKSSVNQEHI